MSRATPNVAIAEILVRALPSGMSFGDNWPFPRLAVVEGANGRLVAGRPSSSSRKASRAMRIVSARRQGETTLNYHEPPMHLRGLTGLLSRQSAIGCLEMAGNTRLILALSSV